MTREYHYWLVSYDRQGKLYLIYGCPAREGEGVARQKGLEMLSSEGLDFQICRFPTRDLATASALWRGKRLESGEGLRRSTQRQGHDKSLKRLKRRRYGD